MLLGGHTGLMSPPGRAPAPPPRCRVGDGDPSHQDPHARLPVRCGMSRRLSPAVGDPPPP